MSSLSIRSNCILKSISSKISARAQTMVSESDTESSNYEVTNYARAHTPHTIQSNHDMVQKQNQAIEHSFQEIKGKVTLEQTRFIFENLSLIQRNIQGSLGNLKRDCTFQEQSSITSCTEDCNLLQGKKADFQESFFRKNPQYRIIIFRL
jgi:hypothetical protein